MELDDTEEHRAKRMEDASRRSASRPPTARNGLAYGRTLREATPIASLGEWRPTEDRPDLIDIIESSHDGRLNRLLGVRRAHGGVPVRRCAARPT